MIEVNLYAIASGDANAKLGRCVARNRFDKEAMSVSIVDFVKGFLKDNLNKFNGGMGGNAEITEMINSSSTLTRKDLACINYYLINSGYMVQIQNVADDEENSIGVTGDVIEWNVIDNNFIQNDYPTATKLIQGEGMDVPAVLKKVIDQSGLFNTDKFSGLKNPFTGLINNLEQIKKVTGAVQPSISAKIYELLEEMGIVIFCATGE